MTWRNPNTVRLHRKAFGDRLTARSIGSGGLDWIIRFDKRVE
jgi:hypothetical protein